MAKTDFLAMQEMTPFGLEMLVLSAMLAFKIPQEHAVAKRLMLVVLMISLLVAQVMTV